MIPAKPTSSDLGSKSEAEELSRGRLVPYGVLAVVSLVLGIGGAWALNRSVAPQVALEQATTGSYQIRRLDDAVTRALSTQTYFEPSEVKPVTGPSAQVSCTETLGDLVAQGRVKAAEDTDASLIDLAHTIAREAAVL
jgi:hypothetical protein